MTESQIVTACLQWLKAKGIYAWRVNNGGIYRGDGQYSFNGTKGVSDVIGVLPQKVKVTLDGQTFQHTFGNILCIEVKKPKNEGGKEPSDDQLIFLDTIQKKGGCALVVHSVDELEEKLKEYFL